MKRFVLCILLSYAVVSSADPKRAPVEKGFNTGKKDPPESTDSLENEDDTTVTPKNLDDHDHEEAAHLESIGEDENDEDDELSVLNITIDDNRVEHPCLAPGYIFDPINLYTEDKLLLEGRNDTTPLEMRKERRGWRSLNINRYYAVWRDRFYIKNSEGIVSVQLRDGEATSGATLLGFEDNWKHEYILAKMNIFFSYSRTHGSQHALRGETYPLEIQLVHYKKGAASLAEAANEKHGILVVCFLYEQRGRSNPWLEPLVEAAEKAIHPMDKLVIVHGPLSLKALFPMDLSNLQYTGPYFAQPCAREAKYIVFATVNTVSEKQMKKFREIRDFNGDIHPGIFGPFAGESSTEGLSVHVSKNIKLRPLRKINLSGGAHPTAGVVSPLVFTPLTLVLVVKLL